MKLEPMTRWMLERTAYVMGSGSAAAQALREADEFLALYQQDGRYRHVEFYYDRKNKAIVTEKIDLGPEGMGS